MKKVELGLAIIVGLAATSVCAEESELKKAIDASRVDIGFRYRVENVDQEGITEEALASTLRSRIQVQSGSAFGISGLLEVDNVRVAGSERYNNSLNGKVNYPLVADPAGTDINQALLRYQANESKTQVDLGRQRVNQLNQRFLGSVAWRQNEQTFDGYRYQQKLPSHFLLDISYLYNVNRVFGPSGVKADEPGDFNNVLVQWAPVETQQLAFFYHDFNFDHWAVRSSVASGADYLGSFINTASQKLQLHVALAKQTEGDNSPDNFSNNYLRLDTRWKSNAFHLEAGLEILGGDGKTAFQTPLATLHVFNGYADVFLNTPLNGLRDKWVGAGYLLFGDCQLAAQYHRYESDESSINYGDEVNFTATHNINKQLQLQLKFAHYSAENFSVDTDKLWLTVSYTI
jgi:Alginate export